MHPLSSLWLICQQTAQLIDKEHDLLAKKTYFALRFARIGKKATTKNGNGVIDYSCFVVFFHNDLYRDQDQSPQKGRLIHSGARKRRRKNAVIVCLKPELKNSTLLITNFL